MSAPKGNILANTLNYIAGQGAMAAFGLVSSILLARYLPKTVFGEYSYLIALAVLFLPFLDLGGHTLYAVLGARTRSSIGVSWARAIALKIYALPLAVAIMAVYFLLTAHALGTIFALTLIYTVAQSFLLSTDIVFRSAEQGRSWAIRRVVYETTALALIVVALIFFHVRSATTLMALASIAVTVAWLWAMHTVVRLTGLTWAQFLETWRRPFHRAEIKALWPFALNTTLWVIYYRETNVLLESLGAQTDLADFRVAFVIMTSALYIPKAVTWATVPRIAFHDEQANLESFKDLIRRTAGVNTYVATFLTLGGLIYGERLIAIVFGHKYAHLGPMWTLFSLVLGLLFVQQFCTDLLNGIRQERHVVYALLAGIAILTALSIVLIPRYGTAGAAAAQLVACMVMVPMNLWTLARRVGVENLHGVTLWRLGLVGAVSAAIGVALLRVDFYLSIAVFFLAFGAMSYAFGAMPEQFVRLSNRILGFARRRLGWQ
jgi:O-antigen/teichoic acid export membrane protein